jgi:hypothetical protein
VTISVVLVGVLVATLAAIGASSHTLSPGGKQSAASVSKRLCASLPDLPAASLPVGLNGVFDIKQFASSAVSMGTVGERGLSASGFVGGCASTTSGNAFHSDRLLFSFKSQAGALRFAAYTFNKIVPTLTNGGPSGPDTVSDIAGSLFEFYDTTSEFPGDIGFVVRGVVAAEVAIIASGSGNDVDTSFDGELLAMSRKLSGRSAVVTLGQTGPTVSDPVRSVVVNSTTPGSSVDLPEAVRVTQLLWQYRQLALNESDVKALPLIESGAVLGVDRSLCFSECEADQTVGAVVAYSPIVPAQSGWPAEFLTSVVYAGFCGQLCVDTFVAVQARHGAPWRISLYISFSGQDALESSGLGPSQPAELPDAPVTAPIESLQADYARYLQSLAATGSPPRSTPLAEDVFSDKQTLKILNIPPDGKDSQGVSRTTTFAAGPLSSTEFGVDFDVTTLCGTYTWATTAVPSAGKVLVQPTDRSIYGSALAPGSYTSVSLHGTGMVCFDIYPYANEQISTVGNFDAVVSGTGRH